MPNTHRALGLIPNNTEIRMGEQKRREEVKGREVREEKERSEGRGGKE